MGNSQNRNLSSLLKLLNGLHEQVLGVDSNLRSSASRAGNVHQQLVGQNFTYQQKASNLDEGKMLKDRPEDGIMGDIFEKLESIALSVSELYDAADQFNRFINIVDSVIGNESLLSHANATTIKLKESELPRQSHDSSHCLTSN